MHDTVFRSVWNHGLVPWVPSLPQDCWFIKVMLFIFALDTSLDTSESNVGKIRYISQFLCVFMFISSIVVVQLLSCVPPFEIPSTVARKVSLFFTISQSLLKFMSIESVMLSHHLILCCPLLLLPSIFPSIRVLPNESIYT